MQTSRAGRSDHQVPTMELLRPPRRKATGYKPRPLVEIEDAVFETVVPEVELADCDYSAPEGLFVPHVSSDGQISNGYRHMPAAAENTHGRLDLFSGKVLPIAAKQASRSQMAGPAFLTGIVAIAAAFFWMAGANAFMSGSHDELLTATVPVEKVLSTASVSPFRNEIAGNAEMVRPMDDKSPPTAPTPPTARMADKTAENVPARPARIERAGSILMIRSGS